jgi:hypothetical protein
MHQILYKYAVIRMRAHPHDQRTFGMEEAEEGEVEQHRDGRETKLHEELHEELHEDAIGARANYVCAWWQRNDKSRCMLRRWGSRLCAFVGQRNW